MKLIGIQKLMGTVGNFPGWFFAAALLIIPGNGPVQGAVSVIEVADFSNTAATPTVISSILGIGSNAVSGTLPGVSSIPDVDVFQVDNPGELGMTGITISFSNFIAGSPSRPAMVNLLAPNAGTLTANGNGSFLLPATINNASTLIFELVGPGQRGSEFITAGSAGYVVTIATIPEPSAFLFLAGAALSFLVLPRQKQK